MKTNYIPMEEKTQLLVLETERRNTSTMLVEFLASKGENSSSRRYSVFSLGLTFFLLLLAESLVLALLAWIITLQLGVDIKGITDLYTGRFNDVPTDTRLGQGGDFTGDPRMDCCTSVDININRVLKKYVEVTVEDYLGTSQDSKKATAETWSTSFDDQDRSESSQQYIRSRRKPVTPKAHLHPIFEAELLPGYETPETLANWTTRTQSSFLDRMSYSENGHVTVSVSGFYFIYSQISFRQSSTQSTSSSTSDSMDNGIHSNIVHDVMLRPGSSTSTRKLMSNTETPKSSDNYKYSTFMSCVLNLDAGDEIYLRAQVPGSNLAIVSELDTTYFGLILLYERRK